VTLTVVGSKGAHEADAADSGCVGGHGNYCHCFNRRFIPAANSASVNWHKNKNCLQARVTILPKIILNF